MELRLTKSDQELLSILADAGVLTTTQVAVLRVSSKKVVRRRLSQLTELGLVVVQRRALGRAEGQPEKVRSLSESGFGLLRERGLLPISGAMDQLAEKGAHCADHRILLNWFKIHLQEMRTVLPRLSVDFHASESPFVPRSESGASLLQIHVAPNGEDFGGVFLVPDAVFRITDSVQEKSVLFFLEVDMGTESLAGPKRNGKDLRQKILNYQALFRSEKYKMFQGLWGCNFAGFRMLLLANTAGRATDLCRLVQEMPPSDFIWVTDQERMFAHGLADAIWARGGNSSKARESILGPSMARSSALPPIQP